MSSAPANAEAAFVRARELWNRNDVVACEATLHELLAHTSAHAGARSLLAQLLQTQGRFDAASALVFDGCRRHDFTPESTARAVEFIRQCQRQQLADELCEATIARHAVPAMFLVLAGHVAREVGDFARARARYLAAIDAGIDLDAAFVLGALAHTLRYDDANHPDFARFIAHFRAVQATPRARAATGFGLAKAYDDVGDHESAACILREANDLVRAQQPWSTQAWRDFIARRRQERVAPGHHGTADFIPVFVLGLPRSGTTLTATRLARHARTRDRGELRALRFIAGKLIGGDHLLDAGAIAEGAALYHAQARQDDAPATWYVDQDPLNFRYLHVVAAMFPQARIVLCRRDRRDTALSLWSQDFAHEDCAFAYDFAEIADYMDSVDELVEHWQRTLPLPIHVSNYEDFVTEPASALARLREFIGLPNAIAETNDTSAPIDSSSIWQARQPVYTRSVGRWRTYAPFIPELARFPTR
jgi:tetratricopeptide (TPR) repeat protein